MRAGLLEACGGQVKPVAGECKFVVRADKRTWQDAQNECKKLGGNLASIHNVAEHNHLYSKINKGATHWIGINDLTKEGTYVNADGSPMDYKNY